MQYAMNVKNPLKKKIKNGLHIIVHLVVDIVFVQNVFLPSVFINLVNNLMNYC